MILIVKTCIFNVLRSKIFLNFFGGGSSFQFFSSSQILLSTNLKETLKTSHKRRLVNELKNEFKKKFLVFEPIFTYKLIFLVRECWYSIYVYIVVHTLFLCITWLTFMSEISQNIHWRQKYIPYFKLSRIWKTWI